MKKVYLQLIFVFAILLFCEKTFSQGSTCSNADPFCTGTTYTFPNTTGVGDAGSFGCLSSSPNPAWYFMEIDQAGTMQFNVSQVDASGTGLDVDFAIWGPFTSTAAACTAISTSGFDPIQSSYSTDAIETVGLGLAGGNDVGCASGTGGATTPPPVQVGEFYMLLLTNYSDDPGTITFNQTGGTGSADCSFICGITGFTAVPTACNTSTNLYSVSGTLTLTNPPATGTCTITSSCGGSQVFNMPSTSMNYSFPNLTSNGANCTITATFSADGACNTSTTYTAPASCLAASCAMTGMNIADNGCDPTDNSYDLTGTVSFTNPPASGTLTITGSCGGTQTFNAPFTSPQAFSFSNINADGTANCSVTAVFSADGACTITSLPFTEPVCSCFTDSLHVNIGACDPTTNTYSVDVYVEFTTAPATGTLDFTVCGQTQSINMPAASPQTMTFTGLAPDGALCNAGAYFSADPTCGLDLDFNAPLGCDCTVDLGTFTGNINGNGQTDYLLCFNDVLNIFSNGDDTPFEDETANGIAGPYDPGMWLVVYSCPPSIFPSNDFTTDPCLLGVFDTANGNWDILNDLGDGSTYYFVPLSMYSMVNGTYGIYYLSNPGVICYDLGPAFPVTFLPEVTATGVESCPNGTVTVTVQGGVPATTGGNFTASNLLPATASFNNTTAANGGTIVVSGLTDGQMYSFDITDANGCPVTFSGGPFNGPDATTINPAGPFCVTAASVNLTETPVTAGTWTGTGITNGATGTFDPATAGLGTHTITFTPSGCFLPSTIDIVVNDSFDATIAPTGPFCQSNANTFLGATDGGGTWSGTGIVGGSNTTGEFSPLLAGPGNHNITYTITGTCGDVGTTTIQVIADADATITPAGPFCISDPSVNLTAAQTGGVWSGTGITSAANGTFSPAGAGAGTHTITYNISGVCGDQQTTSIDVIDLFPSTITPVGPFCEDDDPVNLVGATPGGTWSGTGITNTATGTFDPDVAGPGTHTITYTLSGSCATSSTVNIVVNPLPVPVFVADVASGCAPLTVTFTDNTTPAATSSIWTIVGETSSNLNGTFMYTFNDPGLYTVTLTLTSAAGCVGSTTVTNMIEVFANPIADFTFGPEGADVTNPTINFVNQSFLNDVNNWNFGGLGTSTQENPSFAFPNNEPGEYTVCLDVATVNGCFDTTCQTIIINDIFIIYVPNAFTPDGDGINDVFLPIISGIDPLSYDLMIFNRWGELIFETNVLEQWWDGTHKSILCESEVYVWKIKLKDSIENRKREYIGHVTLLK